jgi:serine/threonine protein kinase
MKQNSGFASTGKTDVPEIPMIQPGELKLGQQIGEGCFGTVFRGHCRGQEVAIKKLHVTEFEQEVLEEFKKEVSILTHLRHPNIIQLLGACTTQGHLAIVTEFCDAGDLSNLIQKVKLTYVQKCQMLRDVATAMNWLHESIPPVIHRDLKPSNLLVDKDFKVKLCDFGLSAFQWTAKIQDTDTAPGTPLWMAPEVLMGRPLSEKADL